MEGSSSSVGTTGFGSSSLLEPELKYHSTPNATTPTVRIPDNRDPCMIEGSCAISCPTPLESFTHHTTTTADCPRAFTQTLARETWPHLRSPAAPPRATRSRRRAV